MITKKKCPITLLVLLVSLIIVSVSKGVPTTSATAETTIQEILLNITVLDRSDQMVRGLRKDDFRVLDNGKQQKILMFSSAGRPLSYALVVDTSGSMRKLMPTVVVAAKAIVNSNDPRDEAVVIRFTDNNDINVAQNWTQDKALLSSALNGLEAHGGTSLIDATRGTAKYVERHCESTDSGRRPAVIVVTDGLDKDSAIKEERLIKDLQSMNVQLVFIGLVSELDKESGVMHQSEATTATKMLTELAAVSGGQAFFPKKPNEITAIAGTITERLRSQYEIAYAPDNLSDKKSYHKLEIQVTSPAGQGKYEVITRRGYDWPIK
ncbi:MAG TPA: VWA domain-containing protein [Blastocatellia bacterium]|nr:VWA domain-containing protein [Blastocatellia bacterium]